VPGFDRELDGDEALLEKAIPTYPPFGKRVLGDAGWHRMLGREHVELITTDIRQKKLSAQSRSGAAYGGRLSTTDALYRVEAIAGDQARPRSAAAAST